MDKVLEDLKKEQKTRLPKMNLQLFASGGEDTGGEGGTPPQGDKGGDNLDHQNKPEGGKGQDNPEDEDKLTKEFTQAELDEIVKKRLVRERARIEREFADKEAREKEKEKRLKDLSDEEKEIEKLKIEKEELEAERTKLQRRELEMDAKDILIEKELPLEFLDFILGKDVDTTKENIDRFEKQFKASISEEVKKRISTGGLKRSTTNPETNLGAELGKQSVRAKKTHNFF